MSTEVRDLREVDRTQVALVGGKGANLGELSQIEGIRVPAGFCVTTNAFERIIADTAIDDVLDRLALVNADDHRQIRTLSREIRRTVEGLTMPDDLAAAITRSVVLLGEHVACAVRSSATAEDLPSASFAGQQDTYLNVLGSEEILRHVRRCWASLFTERAVTYRRHNGYDHRRVQMAVVVQQMVVPLAAGVLFTADPITSNRKVASVEASFGLGEALVSGRVNPDLYKVRDGEIITNVVGMKRFAVEASPEGGTREVAIEPERQQQPALTDGHVVQLAQLGRRIEAHFDSPQDIEWCLDDHGFQIVQSRPITSLFPIPPTGDHDNHVYLSVGHQQMMTDAMKPLGLSVWQLTTPRPMAIAGGRLFVDVAPMLGTHKGRADMLGVLGRSDPLVGDALETVLEREFIPTLPEEDTYMAPRWAAPTTIETDPAIPAALIASSEASLATLKSEIRTRSGSALLDFIVADFEELRRILFDPHSHQVFLSAMEATRWLNEHLLERLGEKNAADALTQSAPHNVTSEMGLALMAVADVIRPHPELVAFLQNPGDDRFLDELADFPGGLEARDAIGAYLDEYGMRCVGEIDITRPRWSEHPATLIPLILGNVKNFAPGEGERRFEQGRRAAEAKEKELVARLRELPEGEGKADETKRQIDRVRTFIGYREYPKYHMISRYFVYKQALMEEAERLVRTHVLRQRDDIFFLSLQELQDVVRTSHVDHDTISRRKGEFRSYQTLTPPRVSTSEGEVITGAYRREGAPRGALLGNPVSAGIIEGRARVIVDLADADLEKGDILVTPYTDPSWTPAFVTIAGLVTEVGGHMTHGAVIAREYGLPSVVGVDQATRLIGDGQRIRVNGTDGYVEILS